MKLKNRFAVVGGSLMAGAAGFANAALDPAVAEGINGIKADASELNGLVVPVIIAILGMVIVIKLVKRFGNKI